MRPNVLRTMRYASMVFFPLFWGMALIASDGVALVLGDKWIGMVIPFQLVCIVLPLRALSALVPPALFGIGRPMVNVVNMAISLVVMFVAFLIGSQSGIVGLAMAWLIAYPVVFLVISARSFRVLSVPYFDFLNSIFGACLASAVMVFFVLAVQSVLPDSMPTIHRLVITISSGFFMYLMMIWLYNRNIIVEVRELIGF